MLSNIGKPVNETGNSLYVTSKIIKEDDIARFKKNQGYIYLIHAQGTNRYKIGRSISPLSRLETLKGQSPYPLEIIKAVWTPDAIEDELILHGEFEPYRVYGEWFEFFDQPKQIEDYSLWDYVHSWFTFYLPNKRFSDYSGHLQRVIYKDLNGELTAEEFSIFEIEINVFISKASSMTQLLQCFAFLENNFAECICFEDISTGTIGRFSALRTTLKTASAFIFPEISRGAE